MKKFVWSLAVLFLLIIPTSVYAQGPVTATATWNQVEAPAVAQTFNYSLKIDAGSPVVLTANCVLVNAVTTCSAPVANYVIGVHTVVLTASNASGSASLTTTTAAPPSSPTGLRVVVVIIG